MPCPDRATLDRIFPPERADAFFDAIYGGAEEGAYDISLQCKNVDDTKAVLAFVLQRRPGKCLKCSLTYGLPQVFQRHPIINAANTAEAIATELGWNCPIRWTLGSTTELNDDQHEIPFIIEKAQP